MAKEMNPVALQANIRVIDKIADTGYEQAKAAGTAICPGIGTGIGAVVGGILGAAAGVTGGGAIVCFTANPVVKGAKTLGKWVKSGF